jgi:hypothetical protein
MTVVLLIWLCIGVAKRSNYPSLGPYRWRTLLLLTLFAALVPTILYASPFGPARNLESAVRWLLYGYPAWLLLTLIWIIPGIALAKRFDLPSVWLLPSVAAATQLTISGITHWPPTRWWPLIITGRPPVPSGYIFGVPLEAWENYFYSLWPKTFMSLAAAVSFLIALLLVRPNQRLERPVTPRSNAP